MRILKSYDSIIERFMVEMGPTVSLLHCIVINSRNDVNDRGVVIQ